MNAQRGVNIDFLLAAEHARWEETLPDVCSESEKWKEAMDYEIVSMTKFGVYKALPRSAAGNRQILGARWVYIKEKLTSLVRFTDTEPDWWRKDFGRKLTIHMTQVVRLAQ